MVVCPTCTYSHEGAACSNPGCEANPSVTPAQKQLWREERERRAAEEAERERILAIRRRFK